MDEYVKDFALQYLLTNCPFFSSSEKVCLKFSTFQLILTFLHQRLLRYLFVF